jgi:hypothetical protein
MAASRVRGYKRFKRTILLTPNPPPQGKREPVGVRGAIEFTNTVNNADLLGFAAFTATLTSLFLPSMRPSFVSK